MPPDASPSSAAQPRPSQAARGLRTFWRAETGIFLGLWLLLMIFGRTPLFNDPGTFWHTVAGQRMLASGQVQRTDPFSFTFGGEPWIAYEWLAECGMALLHRIAGLDTLLLATVTLLAGLYTWVAHRLIRAGTHWLLAIFFLSLALATGSLHFLVRPHILSLVFFAWTYARLCDFEAGRIRLGQLLWLVPLCVVWTNVHGAVLGGLGTMGLALAGWCLARILGQDTPLARSRQVVLVSILFLTCALTTLINPFGLDLLLTWKALMASPVMAQIVHEHLPLSLHEGDGRLVALVGLLYLVALVGVWPRWPRVTWLLPLVWFYLACMRIRHAPLFGLAAALALADLLPHTVWAKLLARRGLYRFAAPGGEALPWRAALPPLALVLTAALLQATRVPVPVLGYGWARLDPNYWPIELLPELRRYEQERAPNARIFNDQRLGGFLIYFTPNLRIFIDDRCEVYGDRWLQEYVEALRQDPARIEQWARRPGFEFDHAVVEAGSVFDAYLREASGWEEVRRTMAAVLYRRTVDPPAER